MKAKTVNESLNEQVEHRLKIYKFPDGTYEATRDGNLYTFMWKPYRMYNLQKIGGVGQAWIPQGQLVRKPHIQMILQVQNGINDLN